MPSGEMLGCHTVDGVYDLSGNVSEWVSVGVRARGVFSGRRVASHLWGAQRRGSSNGLSLLQRPIGRVERMIPRYARAEMTAVWVRRSAVSNLAGSRIGPPAVRWSRWASYRREQRMKWHSSAAIDAGRILEIEARCRHDVIAFLSHVEEQVGAPARWLHLGMTSSDVLDCGFALQLRRAASLLLQGIDRTA